MTTYLVEAKKGMTPFATCDSHKAAETESAKAKRLGLSGRIMAVCPECGHGNVDWDAEGDTEGYPREYHAECATKATAEGRDPR